MIWRLVSLLLFVVCMICRPSRFVCPRDWHVASMHESGQFSCVPRPIGDPDYDGTWLRPEHGTQPPGELRGLIYCTGGTCPVVVDDRVVSCQHVASPCRTRINP